MSFFPFSRKPARKSSKTIPWAKDSDEKSELALKLETIKSQERQIRARAEQAKRQVEDIPKLLAERKRCEQELIKQRARKSRTLSGLDRPAYRLPVATTSPRMTRGQQRSMLTRFLILCAVLGVILLLLWKAVP